MNIAIIPARGGSKRIPKKNIKNFCGKPVIGYVISTAINSKLFDAVIVSTDDEEIKLKALELGAEVPFMRPKDISDDITPTVPVVAHAIRECISKNFVFSNVCCIYPASPLIQIRDIRSVYNLLLENPTNYCLPIAEYPSSIQRSFKINQNQRLEPFFPRNELNRTQDLEKAYYDCGQFYWGHKNTWLNSKYLHSNGIGFVIPSWRVVDIDNHDDWERAEFIFKYMKNI